MAIMGDRHSWAFAFGIFGNIISFLVYLAPVPTFYRIYKKKSTECFQSLPYQVALFSSMLWIYYALMKGDAFLLITINSFGCVVETIYISMFIAYATKDKRISAMKLFFAMNVAVFSFILGLSQFIVKEPKIRVSVLGWISVAISVVVFAAPLNIIARVIRTKSVEFMPFTLSFFLTLSAIMWFSYGLLLKDICIALPNVLGFILGLVQMLLYAIFRNTEKSMVEKQKLPEDLKAVVVMSSFGVSDVFVDVAKGVDDQDKDSAKENQEKVQELEGKECSRDEHHNSESDQKSESSLSSDV